MAAPVITLVSEERSGVGNLELTREQAEELHQALAVVLAPGLKSFTRKQLENAAAKVIEAKASDRPAVRRLCERFGVEV